MGRKDYTGHYNVLKASLICSRGSELFQKEVLPKGTVDDGDNVSLSLKMDDGPLFADMLRPNCGNETNVRESVTNETIRATNLFRHLFAIGQLEMTIPTRRKGVRRSNSIHRVQPVRLVELNNLWNTFYIWNQNHEIFLCHLEIDQP